MITKTIQLYEERQDVTLTTYVLSDSAEMTAACTFNEPNLPVLLSNVVLFKLDEEPHWDAAAQAFGVLPDRLGVFQFVTNPKMREVVFAAHRRAFDVLHGGPGDFPVGMTLALIDTNPWKAVKMRLRNFDMQCPIFILSNCARLILSACRPIPGWSLARKASSSRARM